MSVLSQFLTGGGLLKYQDFTASGTFTPSATLLANGGQVMVFLVGGGGGGGSGASGSSYGWGGGGGGGQVKFVPFTVSAATTVTIGAGGTAPSGGTSTTGGTGGTTSFGTLTAVGGTGGFGQTSNGTAGNDLYGVGGDSTSESGVVYKGRPGTSMSVSPVYMGNGASTNGDGLINPGFGISGYGCGGHILTIGARPTTDTVVANSGKGGNGNGGPGAPTAGASGFCRVYWWE